MGISLAPELEEKPDPLAPPKPKAAPAVTAAPTASLAPTSAPIRLAPAPQAPGKAGGTPAPALPTSVPPSAYGNMASSVPAPTVAAPSAPVDRVKLATETYDALEAKRQAKYQADSRDNIRNSAALGQVASGGLRTREGNLQLARERDLDALRQDLVLKATEGSIADAQTAYGQALAGSQQGLAEKIGLAGIDTQKGALDLEREKFDVGSGQSQQQIDLAKRAQEQQFGLETEKLGLAKEGQSASIAQQQAALALQERLGLGGLSAEQQRIAIAQKQQELEAAFNAGKMTLAERDAARADLALAQQNTLNQAQLGLETERLGLARGAQDIANKVALGQLSIAQARQELDAKVAAGQLSLAERDQALRELSQKQGNENEQQRIGLAKEQLAAEGARFGLSLAQQKELATLADKTQNRQLDISSAQGKNSLLLELARIMGAKDLSSIDPNFLASIAAALGVALPKTGTVPGGTVPGVPTPGLPPGTPPGTDGGDPFTEDDKYGGAA